jgi:ComF family protein
MASLKVAVKRILDILLPQEEALASLLRLSAGDMRRLLPKAKIVSEPDAYNLFDYGNKAVRKIVWSIKYKANPEIISRLAAYLYEEMLATAEDEALWNGIEKIIVAPIPSNKQRRREKGFNQCELLAKAIEKNADKDFFDFKYDLLQKIKDTPKQAELHRKERLLNVKNSMSSSPLPPDPTVFVIDDVYTTGATFNEARRALLAAGAKKVYGFFVAH